MGGGSSPKLGRVIGVIATLSVYGRNVKKQAGRRGGAPCKNVFLVRVQANLHRRARITRRWLGQRFWRKNRSDSLLQWRLRPCRALRMRCSLRQVRGIARTSSVRSVVVGALVGAVHRHVRRRERGVAVIAAPAVTVRLRGEPPALFAQRTTDSSAVVALHGIRRILLILRDVHSCLLVSFCV